MGEKVTLAKRLNKLAEDQKDSDYKKTIPVQAEGMGIPYPTFIKYYNGKSMCPIDNLVKISQYYGVSTDYLLGLSDEPTTDTNMAAVCKYTGLSENSVAVLRTLSEENRHSWWMDVLNATIGTDSFLKMLFAITQYATLPNKQVRISEYQIIKSGDIEKLNAQTALQQIMDELKAAFKNTEDNRIAYKFIWNLYKNGDLSKEDYLKYQTEFDRGNFSAMGGKDNG